MTKEEFSAGVAMLEEYYAPRKYKPLQMNVIWEGVKNETMEWFEDKIKAIMAESDFLPLLSRFRANEESSLENEVIETIKTGYDGFAPTKTKPKVVEVIDRLGGINTAGRIPYDRIHAAVKREIKYLHLERKVTKPRIGGGTASVGEVLGGLGVN